MVLATIKLHCGRGLLPSTCCHTFRVTGDHSVPVERPAGRRPEQLSRVELGRPCPAPRRLACATRALGPRSRPNGDADGGDTCFPTWLLLGWYNIIVLVAIGFIRYPKGKIILTVGMTDAGSSSFNPGATILVMRISPIISLAVLGVALHLILTNENVDWAAGAVGTIFGYWMPQPRADG